MFYVSILREFTLILYIKQFPSILFLQNIVTKPNAYFFFQEVMKGVQMMYDITKFRRPSNMFGGVPDGQSGFPPTSPSTPALSVYTIDDEFNLPVSVAFVMLVVYIVIGAIVFCFEEGWGFFESFYFVFISMSTIGFGDFVPKVRR